MLSTINEDVLDYHEKKLLDTMSLDSIIRLRFRRHRKITKKKIKKGYRRLLIAMYNKETRKMM